MGCGEGDGPQRVQNQPADPFAGPPASCSEALTFEDICDQVISFDEFEGGVARIADNPYQDNNNPSGKVVLTEKFRATSGALFGGVVVDFSALGFDDFNAGDFYTVKVWSQRPVNVLFEPAGGGPGSGSEVTHGGTGWEELTFTVNITGTASGYVFIFDNGTLGDAGADPANWTFYIDDISEPMDGGGGGAGTTLPVDFEGNVNSYDFGPDGGFEGGAASVVDNPDMNGNASAQVGQMQKFPVSNPDNTFGGATLVIEPTTVEAGSSFTMKVWSQRQVAVLLQPEPQGPGNGIEVIHSGTGWEELTFSLPALSGTVSGITLIFDNGTMGDAENNPTDWTFYFDDITLVPPGGGGGNGGGGTSGITPEFVLFGTSAAVDVAIPDFVQDVSGPQNFGSNATFDFEYAQDGSFSPVIAVTAGDGYGGSPTWVAFVAVNGYANPIAAGYDTFNVKVKGSPLGTIEVKLIGAGDDSVFTGELATYAGSTDLGDGWYQLAIPLADFSNPQNIPNHTGWLVGPPGDQADEAFVFLLTDVGFSNAGGGNGGGGTSGITPEFVLFGTSAAVDVAIPDFVQDVSGPQNFGSNATFDFEYAQDGSFSPVIAVTAGDGYGGSPTWVAFVAVNGYANPIAAGYDTFNVKVKGSPLGTIEVKLIGAGDDSVFTGELATYAGSTDLGDGWYQLAIPLADFSNPQNIPNHTGWLVGPPGDQADEAFVFLLTDVGFSNAGGGNGGGGTSGITPEFVLFGTSAAVDVAIPDFVQDVSGPQNFGSNATFDFEYAQDGSFSPVIAVTAGDGYGGSPTWVAFVAVNGYANPIAAGYDTFNVKVKGSPLGTIEVKLIGAGDDSVFTGELATYAGSTDLGDGWYQLAIPLADFSNPQNIPNHTGWLVGPPGDQADEAFVFLLTDVGFSNAGGGNGGGGTSGITPEFVLFGTSAAVDVAIPDFVQDVSGPQNFGSNATFDFEYAQDGSFSPVIAVTAGDGYGGSPTWVAFVAVNGYANPIAAGYDTFNVKVKGSPLGTIEVKLIGAGDDSVFTGELATYAGSTDLGDGWYQLAIPLADFSNPQNIPNHTGWLVGPPGDQADEAFVFLLTDVGFSNAGGGNGGGTGTFVNGDFETGDLTGWTAGENGTVTIETSTVGGVTGSFGRLQTTAFPQDVLLSQVALAEGTISPGDTINVSFDLFGSRTDGGVVFVEVIFLNGAGEDVGGRDFVGPPDPYFPSATWSPYAGTVIAGTGAGGVPGFDVSGGVTLQLKAACGGVPDCAVDAYFDNVTFTIN